MTPATFYTVNGPRGVYYAVRNHQTEKIWTERTEWAAQQQAQDEGLALIASETISHAQLLDLMVPQHAPSPAPEAPAGPDEPTRVTVRRRGLTGFIERFRHDHTAR